MLNEANQHNRQRKLCYANADQINAVSELVMNVLRGGVRPGKITLSRLKPQVLPLRSIATPRNSIKRRRQIMMHQLGGSVWQELKRCYLCAQKQYRY